jgi:hypothetical protein
MSDPKSGDYEVGKGRPPRHSRFKAGESGNPKGRAKESRNLLTDLAEEMAERIEVREGGRAQLISKQRALLKALVAKALQGDARAASLLISLMAKLAENDPPPADEHPLTAEDEALLEDYIRRRTSAETTAAGDVQSAVAEPSMADDA